ncbi:tetratricopeptide repeat protein 1 [Orussus abietinus]|uniref:tetratricopeptide repeat protein 1 n=1 Tax=Orussus abietinus TaxID=222816 RepID=UPI000626B0FA|nr:tetratricopeptide repeat protein 1 [Orussus abietinus]XP_012281529.1 tetratricopeptide repeat protein 1 [Orussus abietinus]
MDGKLSPKPRSNEEVIDQLTKDLSSSCSTMSKESDGDCRQSTYSEIHEEDEEATPNKEELETNSQEMLDDLVDEEALKDREIGLSETDKDSLRKEAETLKNEGNSLFKIGEFKQASSAYTHGLQTCPLAFSNDRSILYANRAAAKSNLGEIELAITDCSRAVELDTNYVKAYLRRARLYEQSEKLDEALEDFKKVLTFDPQHVEANRAIRTLPAAIQDKNEKLKAEMLSKFKDLGNIMLKPLGLSTDNFKLEKNPDGEGYSVKFQQNLN